MRNKFIAYLSGVLLTAFCATALIAGAAEKREQTFVKSNFKTVYRTVHAVDDVPNHEVVQEMTVADIRISNPDFKTKEEWAYVHSDLVNGNGPHSGYFFDTQEDGSITYGTFKGMVKTTTKADGSWESTWEGTYQYLGGSGKFKNLKGNGTYKGRVSSQNPAIHEEGRETVQY